MNKHRLDIAWAKCCALYAEARELYVEADRVYCLKEGDESLGRGLEVYNQGISLFDRATTEWLAAVCEECGPDVMIEWLRDGSCIVAGVMLFLPL